MAKGRKLDRFEPGGEAREEIVAAMLGPTGNLRAPCARSGDIVLVGFNPDAWRQALL